MLNVRSWATRVGTGQQRSPTDATTRPGAVGLHSTARQPTIPFFQSQNLSQTVHQHIFSKTQEDVVCAVLALSSNASSHSPYILCVTATRTRSGYHEPKLHLVKSKLSGDLMLKSSKPLKYLERIICPPGFPEAISFVYRDGRRSDWSITQTQVLTSRIPTAFSSSTVLRDEFVWWITVSYFVHYDRQLSHPLDQGVYQKIFQSWCKALTTTTSSSSLTSLMGGASPRHPQHSLLDGTHANTITATSFSSIQRYIINALIEKHRQTTETSVGDIDSQLNGAGDHVIMLSQLTDEEAANLTFFLDSLGLESSDISQLEDRLQQRLLQLQQHTINEVFESQQPANATLLSSLLDRLLDNLEELDSWTTAYDATVSIMSRGIDKIESKGQVLEVEDHNYQNLTICLLWLLSEISLPDHTLKLLQSKSFELEKLDSTVRAALRLDAVIRSHKIPNTNTTIYQQAYAGGDASSKQQLFGRRLPRFRAGVLRSRKSGAGAGAGDAGTPTSSTTSGTAITTPSSGSISSKKSSLRQRPSILSRRSRSGHSGGGGGGEGGDGDISSPTSITSPHSTTSPTTPNNNSTTTTTTSTATSHPNTNFLNELDQLVHDPSAFSTSDLKLLMESRAEAYKQGAFEFALLSENVCVREQRKELRLLSSSFVNAAYTFIISTMETVAKQLKDVSISPHDQRVIASGSTHEVMMTKLKIKLDVDKYKTMHSTLLHYTPLVGACERLQPGTARKLATHYTTIVALHYRKDIESFFKKVRRSVHRNSIDCRLRSSPSLTLTELQVMTDVYRDAVQGKKLLTNPAGIKSKLFQTQHMASVNPAPPGKLYAFELFDHVLDRIKAVCMQEQMFLMNMFVIWAEVDMAAMYRTTITHPVLEMAHEYHLVEHMGSLFESIPETIETAERSLDSPSTLPTHSITPTQTKLLSYFMSTLFSPLKDAVIDLVNISDKLDHFSIIKMLLAAEQLLAWATPEALWEKRERMQRDAVMQQQEIERQRMEKELLQQQSLDLAQDSAQATSAAFADFGIVAGERKKLAQDPSSPRNLRGFSDDLVLPEDTSASSSSTTTTTHSRTNSLGKRNHQRTPSGNVYETGSLSPSSSTRLPSPHAILSYKPIDYFFTDTIVRREIGFDFVISVITQVLAELKLRWSSFVDQELEWISKLNVNPKQQGVLEPFAKLPAFIERLEAVCYPHHSLDADAAYAKISVALLRWLSTIAKTNPKYEHVIVLENCHYYLQSIGNRRPLLRSLESCLFHARMLLRYHRQRYIHWHIDYEMTTFVKFCHHLFTECKARTASNTLSDIPLLTGLSKDDLRGIFANTLSEKQLGKYAVNIFDRLQRQMPKNTLLVRELFLLIREEVVTLCSSFLRVVETCYPHERAPLALASVHQAFETVLPLDVIARSIHNAYEVQSVVGGRLGVESTHQTQLAAGGYVSTAAGNAAGVSSPGGGGGGGSGSGATSGNAGAGALSRPTSASSHGSTTQRGGRRRFRYGDDDDGDDDDDNDTDSDNLDDLPRSISSCFDDDDDDDDDGGSRHRSRNKPNLDEFSFESDDDGEYFEIEVDGDDLYSFHGDDDDDDGDDDDEDDDDDDDDNGMYGFGRSRY